MEKKKQSTELESWFQKDLQKKTPASTSDSLSTSPSQSDFGEFDDYLHKVDLLNEHEIDDKFEELLDDVNLNEEKKKQLRMYSQDRKKHMLVMQHKILKTSELCTPQLYISSLESDRTTDKLNPTNILSCVQSLRVALTNNTLGWVHEFGSRGLQTVFDVLELATNVNDDDTYDKIQLECLKCIKKFVDNSKALEEFAREDAGHFVVANCIDYRKPSVMIAALQTLSVLCFVDDSKLLSVLGKLGETRKCNRFLPIVEGITMRSNDELWDACLRFFNVLLAQTGDLEFRMYLRDEIVRSGLCDKLDVLKNHSTAAVREQVSIFGNDEDDD